ncbi:hypothetical protein ABEB36_010884 [Hypothenemus hampei]|uniref:Nucleoprotein n=1 Tax=Hypothenemus hampei TaxID=57062 RepID=A0ABD1EDN6_HYPHA
MALPEISYHAALQQLRIEDPQCNNKYIKAGKTTDQLLRHAVAHEYVILGRTPEEIIEHKGSSTFDFEALKRDFKVICEDYENDVNPGQKYKCLDFCSRILYEVGPESRQVNDKEVRIKTAFVFKEGANTYTPESSNTKIVLTVRHASLLALLTLERINVVALQMTPPRPLLTPLAGAVFPKDDLGALAGILGADPIAVLCTINASCQSGGQYLPNSRLYVALVAAVVATKNVKTKAIRDIILKKTAKQYLTAKKVWDADKFAVYESHAHGGIPGYPSPDEIIDAFDSLHKINPMQSLQASRQTRQPSSIMIPQPFQQPSGPTQPEHSGSA